MSIEIKNCNLLESNADIICHQVNCKGVMGSGLAKQIREKYPDVYDSYKELCKEHANNSSELLGTISPIFDIPTNTLVVNMFAQDGYGYDRCYTNYIALRVCLEKLKTIAKVTNSNVAIPYKLGCGRGGGDWNLVENMIKDIFADSLVDVIICKLEVNK